MQRRKRFRHARRRIACDLSRQYPPAARDAVEPTVVPDLHDMLAARVSAGETNTCRDRFAAGFQESHLLGARHDRTHHLRHFAFERMRMTEDDAAVELFTDRFIDGRETIAQRDRPQRIAEVDKLAPSIIPYAATLPAHDRRRLRGFEHGHFRAGTAAPRHYVIESSRPIGLLAHGFTPLRRSRIAVSKGKR